MKKFLFALLCLSALAIPQVEVDAAPGTTTKVFSGDSPHKVYQYAQQAGYDYPTEEIRCSQRCRQRWAKDD